MEAFTKEKATQVPLHRPGACAIDLLPNATPLSVPETQTMEDYIAEALASGFIRTSTLPPAARIFFVEKRLQVFEHHHS